MSTLSVSSAEPSALLLSLADQVRRVAREAGVSLEAKLSTITAAELALIATGRATYMVSPYDPTRDETIAELRADDRLRSEVLPLVLGSPAAASWDAPLDPTAQTWINRSGDEPPTADLLSTPFVPFPALATKPLGAMWTSSPFPDLASVWLTDAPLDWGYPPEATTWSVGVDPTRGVRCFEIGSRGDWVSLCEAFPQDSTETYGQDSRAGNLQWEPPFIAPDWNAVAEEYDAVHLKWSGFLDATCEVVPVLNGTTALCGWGSEGTFWLRWMFVAWHRL